MKNVILFTASMMILSLAIPALQAPAKPAADRTIRVVFANQTPYIRTLYITTPAGQKLVGTFSQGGKLSVSIPIYDDRTPVAVSWVAGDQSGSFEVTSDTAGYLRIDLTSSGPSGPY